MATPNAARRRTLAKEGKANRDGSFPTDTKGRAVAAKGRATQAVNSGRMSKSEEKRIDARANRELGEEAVMETIAELTASVAKTYEKTCDLRIRQFHNRAHIEQKWVCKDDGSFIWAPLPVVDGNEKPTL